MNIIKNAHSDVIFGYGKIPASGRAGKDDGGFSIAIYPDGKAIYKKYVFDQIEASVTKYELNLETVGKIVKILQKYSTDIKQFDENLYNGSDDGEANIFIFNGKKITSLNIENYGKIKLIILKWTDFKYYKEYISVLRQEHLVTKIFSEVAKYLKTQGIVLSLHAIEFKTESIKMARK